MNDDTERFGGDWNIGMMMSGKKRPLLTVVDQLAEAVEKFNPHHDAKGRFGSGGGTTLSTGGGEIQMGQTRKSEWQDWGYSHSRSTAIATAAAQIAGISGYAQQRADVGEAYGPVAAEMLQSVAHGGVSQTTFYHGFEDKVGHDWQPGQRIGVSLMSATDDKSSAVGYGVKGISAADAAIKMPEATPRENGYWSNGFAIAKGHPSLIEIEPGARMVGYAKWKPAEAKEFGSTWPETITGGEFVITGVRRERTKNSWWDPEITVITVRQAAVFDPSTNSWADVQKQLRKFDVVIGGRMGGTSVNRDGFKG